MLAYPFSRAPSICVAAAFGSLVVSGSRLAGVCGRLAGRVLPDTADWNASGGPRRGLKRRGICVE